MPHASFKIKPGVDQNETPALNQAGLSVSNLIRFIYDRNGNGLIQKLGGWTKFYPNSFSRVIRAIWPWEDINANAHLAVGTQNSDSDYQSQLSIITNGDLKTVTPQTLVTNIAPSVSTTVGSPIVQITDTNVSGINQYDCVYISIPMTVGGLRIFGLYETIAVTGSTYSINAVDALGNLLMATSTSTSASLPQIVVISSNNVITVNLTAHGYAVGDTFSILIPVTVGTTGITLYGDYIVQSITINSFTINSTTTPSSSGNAYLNNNNQNYTYNFGIGAVSVGSGYGTGGYGSGGYGAGVTTIPSTLGNPVSASNWSFDNWGSYLVSVPVTKNVNVSPLSATGDGTTATISWGLTVFADYYTTNTYSFYVDSEASSKIEAGNIVSGIYIPAGAVVTGKDDYESPNGWAIYINLPITGLTSDQLGVTTTFIQSSFSYVVPVGSSVTLSGFIPSSWNGTFFVTSSDENSFSFLNSNVSSIVIGSVQINYAPYQPIYLYDPLSGNPISVAIPNSPPYNDGVFVAMPQRQLVTWGSTFTGIPDPLLIRWSDVNDFNSWIGTVTNQAGSYRLAKGSKIVGAIQAPQQALMFTDLGVWAMQYVGPPYVYGFNELGTGCGLIARKAVASVSGAVYWMGNSQFFRISGSGVEPVPCPIWDVIFQDLDTNNLDKIRVAVNSLFGEITWYYPNLNNGGENNSYVKYNVNLNCWDFGTLSRSAWTDQSVLGKPIGADPVTGYLYQHETSNDADGAPMNSFFRTGYFTINEADVKSFVDEVWPDMKWGFYEGNQNAIVYITFYVVDFPGQVPEVYGPYPMTHTTTWFNTRFRGRLVSIQLSSNDIGSFWRLGNIRYRIQQDGRY